MLSSAAASAYDRMWSEVAGVGRASSGGYRRYAWTREDATLREWFSARAAERRLDLTADRAGNLWAWWGDPDREGPGVVTGSHLDSVPDGGAYDGPLGIISALAAIDALRDSAFVPNRPIGIACFAEEEGARFGVACAGSRVLTGVLAADHALAAAGVCAAMIFVRNPTGVSHSPAEFAERADCLSGVAALADVLRDLAR